MNNEEVVCTGGNCIECVKRKNASYHSDQVKSFSVWKAARKEFGLDSSEEIEAWNKILGKKAGRIAVGRVRNIGVVIG